MGMDIFKERERSFEEEYFRKHEAKLIEKLRERARLEGIAEALAVKLQVDNPELLTRIMALGVTLDTGAAFLLAPLIQVAWAGGAVTNHERETVLRVATARGVEKGSPAYAQLEKWLRQRPDDTVFDACHRGHQDGPVRPHSRGAGGADQANRRCVSPSGGSVRRARQGARP
jgi:hypothetical protein